ncbi:hypothetical protein [Streptomyces flaveolus]|uniref:hypothetical protein n=1 Tax=Streptomyces flaveolus TaxID=67297 RepID=UPI0036D05AF3
MAALLPLEPGHWAAISAAAVLHPVNDASSRELWPAGIDPALFATTEQRAHRLLARLHRPRP